ncbi:aspartate carbamoyltransferase [Acanthopleuribacter pedis]|uniref:Aspartate carbamoyltransferase n=1 Tax=Acanthopleuribacter pedis TaxID=442870 RepID=A0A8J7QBG6_9BACT|nr:aspartate carbamoyltransferase [Acanthopleuribacter pedis]MBO1317861.1 aspartate carbamoyltransferase [Acanthopleuribacter pedis]
MTESFDFKGRHIIDTEDLSTAEILHLVKTADDIQAMGDKALEIAKGKILATLFWEPSTRTRLSFEAAMFKLGGNVLGFSEASTTSSAKGETLADTIKTVALYADIIAMRNPLEGSAMAAARYSDRPIINGGDGAHLHPTQTLGDIYTLYKERGTLDGLKIGFLGDLLFGRTIHTLVRLLSRFDVEMHFFSPEGLNIPEYVRSSLQAKGAVFSESEDMNGQLAELDVLYVTRIQKERFFSEEEYLRKKNSYRVDRELLEKAKSDILILHPLPRNEEISQDVDDLPNAGYFRQAAYGMEMRMALISKCLGLM